MVKLLMVDDDRAYAQDLAQEVFAALEDVQTRFARDLEDAISSIESDPPDLILLDMNFPLKPADLKAGTRANGPWRT